jgi:hypothetical protein
LLFCEGFSSARAIEEELNGRASRIPAGGVGVFVSDKFLGGQKTLPGFWMRLEIVRRTVGPLFSPAPAEKSRPTRRAHPSKRLLSYLEIFIVRLFWFSHQGIVGWAAARWIA